MVGAKSYFARMNENRGDANWLTYDELLRGTEQFFKLNQYLKIEYMKLLDQGDRGFTSPIVASRSTKIIERKRKPAKQSQHSGSYI